MCAASSHVLLTDRTQLFFSNELSVLRFKLRQNARQAAQIKVQQHHKPGWLLNPVLPLAENMADTNGVAGWIIIKIDDTHSTDDLQESITNIVRALRFLYIVI